MINLQPWPFKEPRDTMLIVQKRVLKGEWPVLCVVRQAGAFPWRIGAGDAAPPLGENWEAQTVLIKLEEVLEFFPWLAELADLPCGTKVTRTAEGEPWLVEDQD